jgi:TatA/E family protein of Tat protein translocase
VFNIGPQELLLILLVALVIVGPKRLPELSRTIGRGLREFRKAQDEVKKTINLGLDESEPTTPGGGRTARTTVPADASGDGTGEADRDGPTETGAETDALETGAAPPADPAADVARTLGRGLAEIRQARREIQRTFRVDLTDEPRTPIRKPDAPSAPAPPDAPEDRGSAGPETPA